VRWETEHLLGLNGQLCHEYVYQKLLKMDNPSSSYVLKNWCVFYASQCTSIGDVKSPVTMDDQNTVPTIAIIKGGVCLKIGGAENCNFPTDTVNFGQLSAQNFNFVFEIIFF